MSKLYTKLDCNMIPFSILELLKKASYEKRLPVSQLVAIAVDNELDAPVPFTYKCDLPETDLTSASFFREAQLIYNFLLRSSHGADRETLLLCRRDIGIEDRNIFLHALRELLLNDKMVEEYRPKRTFFSYDRDYTRLRVPTNKNRD